MPLSKDIIVVGSHVYGAYIDCERLPRPGETVQGQRYRACELGDGGKGSNQAFCASRLGASTSFLGIIGSDEAGKAGVDLLAAEGCDVSLVHNDAELSTGVSVAVIEKSGMSMIITDPGANGRLTPQFVALHANYIQQHKFCLVQFESPVSGALAAARAATDGGAISMITPGPMHPLPKDALSGLDILIPNETEAADLLSLDDPSQLPADAAKAICETWGVKHAVVTRGSEGAEAYWEGASLRVPAFKVTARNTIGAGDGFAAALATALSRSAAIDDALIFAAAVAALAVSDSRAPWLSYPRSQDVDLFLAQA